MLDSRVEIEGDKPFNPREWLRREVLWASLMTPYSVQARTWQDGTAVVQHQGNVTRQELYASVPDAEAQALAFFNHGKNIGGIISSATLFRAGLDRTGIGAHVNIYEQQASVIDSVLGRQPADFIPEVLNDDDSYNQCEKLAESIYAEGQNPHIRNKLLLQASNIMSALACREAQAWVGSSLQNTEGTLPNLTIHDGGYPRSGGLRVEKLQPIFHKIDESAGYQEFSS